jgi:putative thioredoxin
LNAGVDVTEETFERDVVERSRERPVVVDFWAEWCGPCHALAPVLEQAVAERDGAVTLVKVDVDANPELSRRFGVHGIPAVKAFRNGQVVREFVGAQSPRVVANFLDDLTAPSEADRLLAELRERGERPELLAALDEGDHERAFELLLGELDGANGSTRDEVRQLMVALFTDLGGEHPLVVQYRRRLATALY